MSQRFGPWGALARTSASPGRNGVVGEALTGLWRVAQADPRLADLRAARRAATVHRRPGRAATDRRDRGDGVRARAGSAAPGSATARPAWTTSSTPSPRCCARSPSSSTRRCRRRGGPGPGRDDSAGPGGVVVGRGTRGRAQPVPRRARRPRRDRAGGPSAAGIAALGAAGAVGTLAVALAGDRLLDLLDVSDPAARIAAGVVAAIVGGADLVRRPPSPSRRSPGGRPPWSRSPCRSSCARR